MTTTARKAPAKKAAKKAAPRKVAATKITDPPVETTPEEAAEFAGSTSDSVEPQWENNEIPRHPRWGGPLVLPPEYSAKPGRRKCNLCGRRWNGKCPCIYYKRTTNFIDVLQDEYALKAWDRRMVAYGMSQRPDLVMGAAATRSDNDDDKAKLQAIADDAKQFAKASAAATVGTSLHTFTQWIDEGRDLGYVPEAYRADLDAYREATAGIEWTNIESFRVYDPWKVGGTTDRIGWYRGQLTIFDVKTGSLYFKPGPAMQLAMYARSTPYDIRTDKRYEDVAPIRLDIGYIIKLPAGQGKCDLIPVNIENGWRACQQAKAVWDIRNEPDENWMPKRDVLGDAYEMCTRAGSLKECKLLWRNAKTDGWLTPAVKAALTQRAKELEAS